MREAVLLVEPAAIGERVRSAGRCVGGLDRREVPRREQALAALRDLDPLQLAEVRARDVEVVAFAALVV